MPGKPDIAMDFKTLIHMPGRNTVPLKALELLHKAVPESQGTNACEYQYLEDDCDSNSDEYAGTSETADNDNKVCSKDQPSVSLQIKTELNKAAVGKSRTADQIHSNLSRSDVLKPKLNGLVKRKWGSVSEDAVQPTIKQCLSEQQHRLSKPHHIRIAVASSAVSAGSDTQNRTLPAGAHSRKLSASTASNAPVPRGSSLSTSTPDSTASGGSGNVTSVETSKSGYSSHTTSASSATSNTSASTPSSKMALSASDSSPSPPPAKRNRHGQSSANGQQAKNTAAAKHSWYADALVVTAGANADRHGTSKRQTSPTRYGHSPRAQRGASVLPPSVHTALGSRGRSPERLGRSRERRQTRSTSQSLPSEGQSRSPVKQSRAAARGLEAPDKHSSSPSRLSRSPKRRCRSIYPSRRTASYRRRRRRRALLGRHRRVAAVRLHEMWQEQVRARLRDQGWQHLQNALATQQHARAGEQRLPCLPQQAILSPEAK